MKYVYVLVSDEKDLYLEQCQFSLYSLRNKMPNAVVMVLTDVNTAARINNNQSIASLIDELKIIETPKGLTKKEGSRWLKTSMRKYTGGDFLYIDCDTIILDELQAVSELDICIGAVLDNHLLLKERFKNLYERRLLRYRDKRAGFVSSSRVDKFFNGGLVFSRDNRDSHAFFDEWHKLWILSNSRKISDDQPAFNQANYALGGPITEIDGIWNCQIHYGGMPFFEGAKILHYFIDPRWEKPLYIIGDQFFKKLRENAYSKKELDDILFHIKSYFSSYTHLIADKKLLMFIDTAAFSILRRLFNYKWVVSLDIMLSGLLRLARRVMAWTKK
jgi:hypothetical protein